MGWFGKNVSVKIGEPPRTMIAIVPELSFRPVPMLR